MDRCITIRQATQDDLEGICALAHDSLPKNAADQKEKRLKRVYDPQNEKEKIVGFVAESGGNLLGYASIDIYPHQPLRREVGDLFVARNARGTGIANSLADEQMKCLDSYEGIIDVGCVTSAIYSQRIYCDRGFIPIGLWFGICPNYNREGDQDDSAVMMVKPQLPDLKPWPPIYVPDSFRDITAATVSDVFIGYDNVDVQEAKGTTPSQRFLDELDRFLANAPHHQQQQKDISIPISLHNQDTLAHITCLQDKGYYFSGFVFSIKDDAIQVHAQFRKRCEMAIKRGYLNLIPEAEEIAEFVLEQYDGGRR